MHRSSESIASLAVALAKAQIELTNPEKSLVATIRPQGGDAERSFRYASLASGLDIVRKTLGQHEIATMQTTAIDQAANTVNLTTVLAHASGEWIASDWPVCAVNDTATPHRMGAALTYARRYALFTLVGIAGEDDLDAPDLVAPKQPTPGPQKLSGSSGPTSPRGSGNGWLNGRQHRSADGTPTRREGKRNARPDAPILGAETSAELRDRLLGEVTGLGSGDDAAVWAHRRLPDKNKLTAADAHKIEEAFQSKLAAVLDDSVDEPHAADRAAALDPPQTPVKAQRRGRSKPPSAHGRVPPQEATRRSRAKAIDKSALRLPEPRRVRDRDHLRYVAKQPCLVCGRQPSDPHHLRFTQSRALGRKASDEFTVPLCRGHHREVHRCGDEAAWWSKAGINPTVTARALWLKTHPLPTSSDKIGIGGPTSIAAAGSDDRNSEGDRPVSRRRPNYKTKPIIAARPQ